MAAGVKRKGAVASTSSKGQLDGKRSRAEAGQRKGSAVHAQPAMSDEDDFDDGEDLLAAAMERGDEDDEDEDDDDESQEDDDAEMEMYSDEDLEGGFIDVENEEEQAGGNGNVHSVAKASKKSLFAIPSRDEMNELVNTSGLYKSNIFRLKIDEMLNEVRPKYEKASALEFVLRHVKSCIESIRPIPASTLPVASKQLSKLYPKANVKTPFPNPLPKADSPLKYAFDSPAKVQVAGSWILKTATLRPEGIDVDLIVTMPSSLFQEKDHMNLRYFYKRAFYLAVIASALSVEPSIDVDFAFAASQEDVRKTILVLKPKRNGSPSDFSNVKASIKIHLAHESDVFAVGRLAPSRNNLRIPDMDVDSQPATPRYNASVLLDSLYVEHLVYLNTTASSCPEFANAAMLLKVWSSQRAFGNGRSKAEIKGKAGTGQGRRIATGSGSVRFVLTMLLAHLLNGADRSTGATGTASSSSSTTLSRLSTGFSSYQLFRGVIDFLANHSFDRQPVFMKAIEGVQSYRGKITADDFLESGEEAFVDPTGSVNLLLTMTSNGTFAFLQREAQATLALLNDADEDHFDEIFLRDQSNPKLHFDELVALDINDVKLNDALLRVDSGSQLAAGVDEVTSTLSKGLTNRKSLIATFGPGSEQWPLTQAKISSESTVEVGYNLDATHAFRLVDHGPKPEDAQAAEAFKAFWGDLSELRRFRDGRIVESVVWSANGPFERLQIPRRIAAYVLSRHHAIKLEEDDEAFFSPSFDSLLISHEERLKEEAFVPSSLLPSQVGFQPVLNAFDELAKTLRGLKDLPLSLISVVGSDAGLRGTSAIVPCPLPALQSSASSFSASHMPALQFVMTFESSGQWPDDIVAIRAMKMAFYESMAIKLTEALEGCQARIVLDVDADENALWDASSLEVIVASGFAFQGRIHHAREEVLLQRILDNEDTEPFKARQARLALDRYDARFMHAVRHHNHIAALSHRFSSFAQACRFTKRWINAQLFGNQVGDELIELIVAKVYIEASRAKFDVPSRGHVGFLQTLRLLATWQWREIPLCVPIASATAAVPSPTFTNMGVKRAIERNFEQIRKLDPSMHRLAWFIATEDEPKGVSWAVSGHERQSCSVGTADALQRLAKAACQALDARPNASRYPNFKALFVPSHEHFDFVIRLEPAALDRYVDCVQFDEKALKESQKRLAKDPLAAAVFGKAKSSSYRNLAVSSSNEQSPHLAGLNTGLAFVRVLESLYLDSIRLYYDGIGGATIGGLFNPALLKPRPFRVGLGFNSTPAVDEQSSKQKTKDVHLNREALMDEIRRVGHGLVREVVLQRA